VCPVMVRSCVAELESMIRRSPAEWAWIHPRWRDEERAADAATRTAEVQRAATTEVPPAAAAEAPAPAPVPPPQAAPAAQQPPVQAPPPADKPKFSAPFGPPPTVSGRIKQPAAPPPEEKKEEKPAAPAAAPASMTAPGVSSRTRLKWGVEMPLVPTHTFESLQSGSYNRFAHAAAMAVVDSPGTMYNPLLIFGVPGTGKTHFMHSIAYGLSAALGQDKLFVTDGIRFSKGVELAIKDGSIEKLDKMFSYVKGLVIDDVHLLMLTGENKKYISKWLNEFMSANKQIVVSSVFPPKALAGLEDSLGFQLSQGWMVDVKIPPASAYKTILSNLLASMDVKLSDEDVDRIFMDRMMSFNDVTRTLEQLRKLEKFVSNAMSSKGNREMLDTLLGISETAIAGAVSEADYGSAMGWQPAENQWFKWGLFYPKGYEKEAKFALYSASARAKELGISVAWSQVFTESYDPDELYGTPFRIGNFTSEKTVNGLIILGPQPSSALGAQEAEFRHITEKILRSYSVKNAWLSSNSLKSPSAYARLLMDLM
ncbi:MAG: DnaA/Hda family protein, partial [Elusimicrobiales bacterium]|nr:DnaA/Hda family protein [Elusimicrobiales bacterium]